MTTSRRVLALLRRHPLAFGPVVVVFALLSLLGVREVSFKTKRTAIPLPLPVYDIESVSNGHKASLLNLKLGQPGVLPQAPIPVDVDGDLIPDVLVAVNLIETRGLFNNPPDVNKILAPNISIERVVKGIPLGSSPPLRINVKLRIKDAEGKEPDTILRFGYDTAQGGSIPNSFKAVVNGLQTFFNPLEAVVDTKTSVMNPDTPFIYYEGPLTLVAGVESGDFKADADLAYKPFPDAVRVKYTSDDKGQHFEYAHGIGNEVHLKYGTDVNGSNVRYIPGELPEVDLNTKLNIQDGLHKTVMNARVDRMPRKVSLDLGAGGANSGSADYHASSDGRLPDVQLDVADNNPGQRPLNATLNLDGLPQEIHAKWSLPNDAPASASFDASGAGLRSVQADIRNYDGVSPAIPGFVSPEQQFLNFQQVGVGPSGPDRRITGRVERIRHLQFAQSATGGLEMDANVGDGELPMLAHFMTDDRNGIKGSVLDGTATVAPMPDHASVAFDKPAQGSTDPMVITYEASEAVDVDGAVELRKANSGPNCGDRDTLCASLKARHMPSKVVTSVLDLDHETHIDIDSTLREGGAHPDFFADAKLGQADNVPLVAHAELLGAPRFVRILTHEGADQSLDRAEFHACDFNFSTNQCAAGTDEAADEVGALSFSIRNWINRPANLPPPTATTPMYASVVARGTGDPHNVLFEAAGRIDDIREVDYRNVNGVAGVRTRVGASKPFSAHADFGQVAFKPDDVTPKRFDVLADVLIPSLPSELDVCFRQSNHDVVAPTSTFTKPCESNDPFSDGADLTKTPLSFAYVANAVLNVKTKGVLVDRGIGFNNTNVADDHTTRATVNIYNLPKKLNFDLQVPPEGEEGRIRALFVAPRDGGPQINIDTDFQKTDGDLVCKDPRSPAVDQQAMCVRARLENLPEKALVSYDPSVKVNNLNVTTSGENLMNIIGFENDPVGAQISMVTHGDKVKAVGGTADVLIAEGRILGLPTEIIGTLDLPATVDIRVPSSSNSIQTIKMTARNFIGPDVLPAPGQRRTAAADGFGAVPVDDMSITFLQRGDLFKATVDVGDLYGGAYRSGVDGAGTLLDSKTLRIDFGAGHKIRAYADLADLEDPNDPSSLKGTIADVTLDKVPRGINVCFRGKKTPGSNAPVAPGFCDNKPTAEEGAFSFYPDQGGNVAGMDVFAFIRFAKAGNTDVLAARADVFNIPNVVQGTFASDGKIEFGGFSDTGVNGVGTTRKGIGQVKFDLATFDIPTSGYPVQPWDVSKYGPANFPNSLSTPQQLRLRVDPNSIRAAGTIGANGASGRIESVLFDKVACPPPPNAPSDYQTLYPATPGVGTTFTCIRALFESGVAQKLGVDVQVDKDGKRIAFHHGGLDRLPDFIQLTLAKAPTTDASGKFLRACGPGNPAATDPTCMPPLIRFDSQANAVLAGLFDFGTPGDLQSVDLSAPAGTIVPLAAVPPLAVGDPNGWSEWGSDPKGLRARLNTFEETTPDGPQSRVAVKAGLRLDVPKSMTIDQAQTWSTPDGAQDEAKDIKFHVTVRDGSGVVTSSIGQPAAMINLKDGKQILVDNSDGGNLNRGFDVPGELGLGFYLRHRNEPDDDETDPTIDSLFAQIDGRISRDLNAHARIFGLDNNASIDAIIKDVPKFESGDNTDNPSFRIRFEMAKQKKKGTQLCPLVCVETNVGLSTINANIDFHTSEPVARRVDAFINMDTPRIGLDIQSFKSIDPADGTTAEITANAGIAMDPFNLFIHAGIPVLGSFDMVLESDLAATANIDSAHRFQLGNNLLHLKAESQPAHNSSVTVAFEPHIFAGALTSIFGIFIGNPIIYGFVWIPVPAPVIGIPGNTFGLTANLTFLPCPFSDGGGGINTVPLSSGTSGRISVYGWPFSPVPEPRWVTFGALGTGFDILGKLASPIFCALNADFVGASGHPGPAFTVANHAIPGTPNASPPSVIPPPPPPPDIVVSNGQVLEICGDKLYHSVKVETGGILRVANALSGTNCVAPPLPDPPNRDLGTLRMAVQETATITGRLEAAAGSTKQLLVTAKNVNVTSGGVVQATLGTVDLLATEKVEINGSVLAKGTIGGGPGAASGRSGAGHGGAGGLATGDNPGTPGVAYGNTSTTPVDGITPSDAGSAGAPPKNGGGIIRLGADEIIVGGTVDASGLPGDEHSKDGFQTNDTECFKAGTPAGPDNNPPAVPPRPNTGLGGDGGGSGGGIVLSATTVSGTGTVTVAGGAGGKGTRGGGGGGAGGSLKIISPLVSLTPVINGGAGGVSHCLADYANGGAGADANVIRVAEPTSNALPFAQFWNKGTNLHVPFHAAAPPRTNNPTFTVIACASFRPPSAALVPTTPPPPPNYGIDIPANPNSLTNPCNTGVTGDSVISELARTTVNGNESADGAFINVNIPTDGFYGIYTVAIRGGFSPFVAPPQPLNDCFSTADNQIFGPGTGGFYDTSDCKVEDLPVDQPDTVIGIDNTLPTADVTNPGPPIVNKQDVNILVSAKDDMTGAPGFSGVAAVQCSNTNVNADYKPCNFGQNGWKLPAGTGDKTVYVRAIDLAGNVGLPDTVVITLDTTTPTSSGVLSPATPNGANGWYHSSPSLSISNFNDNAPPPATGRFKWWVDGGTPTFCDNNCVASPTLSDGVHTFYWQAIDAIGNEENPQSKVVRIDTNIPKSVLLSVPDKPDGNNGWTLRKPWVVISAIDPPGGSGLVDVVDPPTTTGIFYSVDGTQYGPVAPAKFVPFQLDAGHHDVCWHVVDLSGWHDVPVQTCQAFDVDLADPTVIVTPTGTGGTNGWYTSFVDVNIVAPDTLPGSTVDPAFDDQSDLCATVDPEPTPLAKPSGICVSVDAGAFVPYTGTIKIGEGLHRVRAYSIDVAGRRSTTVELPLKVDLSHPVSAIRIVPPEPARNGWWRTTPRVVLRAVDGDQNSGVRLVRYKLDASPTWTTYSEPFSVPEGVHSVTYQALDFSGPANDEPARTFNVPVDLTPPVAKALSPSPLIWSKLLSSLGLMPKVSTLNFSVSDNLAHSVHIYVIVYDELGTAVRRIDGGERAVTPGVTYYGGVAWDGTDQSLTGILGIGIYHYRVVAIDEAGNRTQTGESKPLQIKLL